MKKSVKENEYSRKQFLRTAGSTALFAALGITVYGCGNTTSPYEDQDNNTNALPPESGDEEGSKGIVISDNGNKIEIDLSVENVENLKASGGWLLIGAANTLVVNVDGTKIRAFTSVCTHSGCSDDWVFNNQLFECNCHGSRFNTDGAVVRGPANSDLAEFKVERENDNVTITK